MWVFETLDTLAFKADGCERALEVVCASVCGVLGVVGGEKAKLALHKAGTPEI